MAYALPSVRRVARRISLAIALSTALLMLLAGSVLAAPPTLIRESSTFAGAFYDECVIEDDGTEVCTFVDIQVFSAGADWNICVFRSVATFPPDGDPTFTSAFGCTVVDDDAFSINRKLTSATLQPTVVTLFSYTCDEFGNCTETTEDVTVSASWTGEGDLFRFRDKSSFQEGQCRTMFMGKGEGRDATATITIDGQTLQADDAILITSQTSLKISSACP